MHISQNRAQYTVYCLYSMYFELYIVHCVLESTDMSVKLMHDVVCNELPVFLFKKKLQYVF